MDEIPLEPRFVVCRCDHCRNGIEFDVIQLAGRATCQTTCPHCGKETTLREPPPPPRLIPDEGWTQPIPPEVVIEPEPPVIVPPPLPQTPVQVKKTEAVQEVPAMVPRPPVMMAEKSFSRPPTVSEPPLEQKPIAEARPSPPAPLPPWLEESKASADIPVVAPPVSSPLGEESSQTIFLKAPEPKPITVTLPPDPPVPTEARSAVDVRWLTDLGVVYFRQHQFGEAFLCFTRAAKQGFPTAQFCLAVCYFNGHGTAQDEAAALPWLRQAAARGNANAEFTLSLAYSLGRGVSPDARLADEWLQKAAVHGHPEALARVREMNPVPVTPAKVLQPATSPASPLATVERVKELLSEKNPSKPRHDLQRLIVGLFKKK